MCLCNVDLNLNSAKLHIEAKIVPLMAINRTIRTYYNKHTYYQLPKNKIVSNLHYINIFKEYLNIYKKPRALDE